VRGATVEAAAGRAGHAASTGRSRAAAAAGGVGELSVEVGLPGLEEEGKEEEAEATGGRPTGSGRRG